MASRRFLKCSICNEAKPKLTMFEGDLHCPQCMEKILNPKPHPKSGVMILKKPIGQEEFLVEVKQETKELHEENHVMQASATDISEVMGLLIKKEYENTHSTIDMKPEITIEETQVLIDAGHVPPVDAGEKLSCIYCGLSCKTERQYRTHIRQSHAEDRKVNCTICYFTCKGETLYRQHLQEEHDGFECMCKICHEMYNAGEGKRHRPQCKGRHLFQCASCMGYYGKKESLWKHLDQHGILEDDKKSSFTEHRIMEKFYSCKICEDDKVYSYGLYWKHIQIAHQGHHLRCKRCPKTFTSTGARCGHTCVDPTNPTSELMVSETSQKRMFKCSECPKSYDKPYLLKDHLMTHRMEPIVCDVCGDEFQSRKVLKHHKITVHTEPKYFCLNCNKKFCFIKNYQNHFENPEENSEKSCEQLQSTILAATEYDLKIEANNSNVQIKEDIEMKEFTVHLLQSHPENMQVTVSHERRKNQSCQRVIFKCKFCKDCFGDKEILWKHLDGHGISADSKTSSFTENNIKEQLYGCEVIDDDGVDKHNLYWEHVKQDAHQGYYMCCTYCPKIFRPKCSTTGYICDVEKPIIKEFKCPECPKIYNKGYRLNEHINSIHNFTPVPCEICGVEIKTRKQYRRHKVIAHTTPKYQCSVCQKLFHYQSYCQTHMLTHRK